MYQVLARKYRPRNFIELVGQNHVSRALTSALERGRLHHAYLFTGTRGVGKTTIARILAKCLNCETGVTSTPCEVCATCTAVNEGRFIDLIEIDAASRTKVEDTRELLDNVPYAPTQGRFKVYLIDEVHMLSTHSFNALLKTLEEPPEHVKFLFATTDPQKLPITVISRCLQFTLRPLAVDEITTHLTQILNKEEIAAEQDAIWQIAESAQGSLRDALSLTDQAIAYGQGEIRHQDVKEMLGLIDRTIIYDLILAIHQNQRSRVSELLLQFRQQALDVSLVLDQFISTLHELALLQYLPDLALKYSAEINQKIKQLSGLVSAQDLQLYYQIACKGRADLQMSVTQEQGFEMCVLRLLAFRPVQINEVIATQTPSSQLVVPQQNQPQHVIQDSSDDLINTDDQLTDQNLSQATSEPTEDFQGAYDEDELEDEFIQAQHNIHEPSSDDYLDDEDVEVIQHADETDSNEQSKVHVNDSVEKSVDDEVVHEQSNIGQLQSAIEEPSQHENLVLEQEPTLTSFGEPLVEVVEHNTASNNDIFFLDPNENESDESSVKDELAKQDALPADITKANVIKSSIGDSLSPQDILKLTPQELVGEWTLDKWEFWFRNSDLSPAVQELAQQGVMKGQIDGESTFNIPSKYEQLLTQLQHVLEEELKKTWSNTVFNVVYQDISGITPYQMQAERKERAFQRASDLLHSEPVVKKLVESFDADIQNIQLKS